jgi:Rrf2 family protein
MILNSETDYAIRIVSCLSDTTERLDARTISERTGVTQRYALKILHKLTVGGVVKSFKGAKGGYTLSESPENITLLEVIELMCGPINFSRCQCEKNVCTHPQGDCLFKETFNCVSDFMREKFSNATFARKE